MRGPCVSLGDETSHMARKRLTSRPTVLQLASGGWELHVVGCWWLQLQPTQPNRPQTSIGVCMCLEVLSHGPGAGRDSPMPVTQLAAAILAQLSLPPAEVANAIEAFRKNHLQELQVRLPLYLPPPRKRIQALIVPSHHSWTRRCCLCYASCSLLLPQCIGAQSLMCENTDVFRWSVRQTRYNIL